MRIGVPTENNLAELAKLVRYFILTSTTEAGSGHPSSSLSAADVMTVLFFKYFRADLEHPDDPVNDRLIFSKGHAAPLLYALYAAAGKIAQDEILRLRQFESILEGHPTPRFPYAEAATGSLGQGLSIGVGMALAAKKLDRLPYRTYVLMGDGEVAEGSVWEAAQLASHYKLENLVAVVDVNRWGQSEETMYQNDAESYAAKFRAFGWEVESIDGHSLEKINAAFDRLLRLPEGDPFGVQGKPKIIVAKTLKGKGVSFLEDKPGWHGKAVPKEDLERALKELGPIDSKRIGSVAKQAYAKPTSLKPKPYPWPTYKKGEVVATRKVYGEALAALISQNPRIVSLDGDTKNSTFAEIVQKNHPEHFFEMYIAEQNMIGVAVGLARRGKIPFASTFAAFLTRAFDQIRMAAVSGANIKCVGSHAGVSIGEDGPSQMGLEDLSLFRSICGSTVLYPSDAISCAALVREAVKTSGIVYIRTNRPATPVLYDEGDDFLVGGSKVICSSAEDRVTVVAAGVTLNEALKAHEELNKSGINIRVIDCYSIKPIDGATLKKAAQETRALLVVEDHWFEGGLGDAVLNVFADKPAVPVIKLAVREMPRSGKPQELLESAGISASHIVRRVKEIVC